MKEAVRPARPSVLVVDDSLIVLAAVEETLEDGGYRVDTCDNPILVASKLRKLKPDLMLLDVDMPAVKGYEVVEALRRSDCLGDTRVVLYSASSSEEDLKQVAARCGAAGAISKSVTGEALLRALKAYRGDASKAGTSRFALQRALVVASPETEATLVELLNSLGVGHSARGAIGVDRALREGGRQFAILDEEAFGGTLEVVLTRLKGRGLLEGIGVVVVGAAPGVTSVSPGRLDKRSLMAAMQTALKLAAGGA